MTALSTTDLPVGAGPRPRGRLARAVAVDLGRSLLGFGAVVGTMLLLWQGVIWLFKVPPYLVPGPISVLASMGQNLPELGWSAGSTIFSTIIGMALSTLIAMGFATTFIMSQVMSRAIMPLLIVLKTFPVLAIAPLIILVFGHGRWNSIAVVALLTFFQIMLAAKKGLESPTPETLEMMKAYGAGFWKTFLHVRIHFALPYIFTGLRISANSAILCAMFAEWLSGAPGLGNLVLQSYSTQKFSLMWAAVLASMTAAYLFFAFATVVERAVTEWSR